MPISPHKLTPHHGGTFTHQPASGSGARFPGLGHRLATDVLRSFASEKASSCAQKLKIHSARLFFFPRSKQGDHVFVCYVIAWNQNIACADVTAVVLLLCAGVGVYKNLSHQHKNTPLNAAVHLRHAPLKNTHKCNKTELVRCFSSFLRLKTYYFYWNRSASRDPTVYPPKFI